MMKAIYGVKDSGKLFIEHVEKIMTLNEWTQIGPGLFKKDQDIILFYVDDLIIVSSNPTIAFNFLKEHLTIEELNMVEDESNFKFIGSTFEMKNGTVQITCKEYIEKEGSFILNGRPLSANDINIMTSSDHQPVGTANLTEIRKRLGTLGWASLHNHRLAFAFSILASRVVRLGENALTMIDKAARFFLRADPDVLTKVSRPEVRLFVDASFKLQSARARVGWVIQLADNSWGINRQENILAWKSSESTRMHGSTTSAEIHGMRKGIHGAARVVRALKHMFPEAGINVYGDCVPALIKASAETYEPSGAQEAEARLINQELAYRKWKTNYVHTKLNIADRMTKLVVERSSPCEDRGGD